MGEVDMFDVGVLLETRCIFQLINVFSSCSEIYSSEEYTSALSKFDKIGGKTYMGHLRFRNAVFMFEIPSCLVPLFA